MKFGYFDDANKEYVITAITVLQMNQKLLTLNSKGKALLQLQISRSIRISKS